LNITRKDIVTFLKSDEQYVLGQPTKLRVNKSVVASIKHPDSLWAIDIIEMSEQYHEDNTVNQTWVCRCYGTSTDSTSAV
jgi:hypothetical protein